MSSAVHIHRGAAFGAACAFIFLSAVYILSLRPGSGQGTKNAPETESNNLPHASDMHDGRAVPASNFDVEDIAPNYKEMSHDFCVGGYDLIRTESQCFEVTVLCV